MAGTDASFRAVPGARSMLYVASHASHILGMPMATGRLRRGPTRQKRPKPSLRKSAFRTPESQERRAFRPTEGHT